MLCLMLTYPVGLGLKFGLRFHLHPYFVYASSKGSGESMGICAGLSEHTFLYNAIKTKISGVSS